MFKNIIDDSDLYKKIIKHKKFKSEFKFAILGAVLFIIFTVIPCDRVVSYFLPNTNIFIVYFYKTLLFILIFYIVSNSEWFIKI